MLSTGADVVMAATRRLVQQAMQGQWQEVPKTVEQRRMILDRLSASAAPQDRQWLGALQQAVAESDAAVAKIAAAEAPEAGLELTAEDGVHPVVTKLAASRDAERVEHTLDMILKSR